MPPRLKLSFTQSIRQPSQSISSFLVPFLHSQRRSESILSSLSDTAGAYNKRKRVGRGASSGKGKTSGRGQKGQKQKGKVPKGFQGGQTSEDVVHGKYGFKNPHTIELSPVNLDRIQDWINQGRIDPLKPITLKELTSSRAIHGIKEGVKLLARDASKLTTPINIIVSKASKSAIEAVEALGGTVTTRYYTKLAIKHIREGRMHPFMSVRWDPKAIGNNALMKMSPEGETIEERVTGLGYEYRLPDPVSRKELEYYRDINNRGYLWHLVKEGETASLFHKKLLPAEEIARLKKSRGKSNLEAKRKEENKLW